MIETIHRVRCDRCGSIIEEHQGAVPQEGIAPWTIAIQGEICTYNELCPRCRKLWARCFADLQQTDGRRKGEEVAP